MKDKARIWWDARTIRERWLLGVPGGVALAALLLTAVVKPLQAARGQALADIRTYQALAARLRAVEPGARPAAPRRTGDPASILSQSAASVGLAVAPNGTAATVADASYEAVVRWIADVEATSALRLAGLAMTPGPAPGRVKAEARFQ